MRQGVMVTANSTSRRNRPGQDRHGYDNDPRYPSPRGRRQIGGFILDAALHGAAAYSAYLLVRESGSTVLAVVAAIAAYCAASAIHRVPFQWIFRTTLGKALFGLVLIRPKDGGRPGFWRLAWVWIAVPFSIVFQFLFTLILTLGEDADVDTDLVLPAVRRRDVRRLRGWNHNGTGPLG